jgi:hypothetical protein
VVSAGTLDGAGVDVETGAPRTARLKGVAEVVAAARRVELGRCREPSPAPEAVADRATEPVCKKLCPRGDLNPHALYGH